MTMGNTFTFLRPMLETTSIIPTGCEDPRYSLFCFHSATQLSGPIHHAISTTLCYQVQAFLKLLLSHMPEDTFLHSLLCSCHSVVQTRWLSHRSSSGFNTTYTTFNTTCSPVPHYFGRNIQLRCFQCSP